MLFILNFKQIISLLIVVLQFALIQRDILEGVLRLMGILDTSWSSVINILLLFLLQKFFKNDF